MLISIIAGFGEFLTYSLRLLSGYWVDKTKRYFLITSLGYAINLLAIPLMSLATHWYGVAILIFLERSGKAIRVPSRDAMLAHGGQSIGLGWGFGLHQAIDRIGAMLGPLIVALVLYAHYSYRFALGILLIPALLALVVLYFAEHFYQKLKPCAVKKHLGGIKIDKKRFYRYVAAVSFIGAGYTDFPLMAYHLQTQNILSPVGIPMIYAISVGSCTLFSPFLGYWFDKKGMPVLFVVNLICVLFAPLVFLGQFNLSIAGVMLWGLGTATQASLMRAVIAHIIPQDNLGFAYGVFNTCFGFFWFLGSAIMGALYLYSPHFLVMFSVIIQCLGLAILYFDFR